MILVREARPADDARIGQLLVDAFVTAYAKKMPEVVVSDTRKSELLNVAGKRQAATVLVVERDGLVVGTVALFRPESPGSQSWIANYADLRHLATDVAVHGQGYSRVLIERCKDIARRDWNCSGISIHVRRGATGLVRLYEAHGFKRQPNGDFELPGTKLDGYTLCFRRYFVKRS